MHALRVDGVERNPAVGHAEAFEPDDRIDGSRVLDGVDYPLALVEWHDAWFDHDQLTSEDGRAEYLVRTVGFLIDQGSRVVSVAQELLPDGEGFRAVTHIPVAVVDRIVRIGPS
jgi:hypothetical protein